MGQRLVVACVTVASVLVMAPAEAGHRPNVYCSPSGDVCQSTRKIAGVRKLRIGTAARYFGRFDLCVTAPDDTTKCKTFRMRKNGSIYSRAVRWKRHFPDKGPGAYTVKWKFVDGGRIGRVLGFHR